MLFKYTLRHVVTVHCGCSISLMNNFKYIQVYIYLSLYIFFSEIVLHAVLYEMICLFSSVALMTFTIKEDVYVLGLVITTFCQYNVRINPICNL